MRNKKNVSECPLKLKQLIDEANSLPKNYALPSNIGVLAFGSAFRDINALPIEQRKMMFIDAVKDLPLEFTKLQLWIGKVITGQTVTFDESFKNSSHKIYRQLYKDAKDDLKENLWYEVELLNENEIRFISPQSNLGIEISRAISARKHFNEIIEWNKLNEHKKERGFFPSSAKQFLIRIKEGIISIECDALLNIVIREKLNTRRFLECPSCSKIVWKRQITANTCGEKKCVQQQKYLKKTTNVENNKDIDERRKLERQKWLSQDFNKKEIENNGTL